MYKSASDVRPNGKDFEKQKELEQSKESKPNKPLEENNKPDPVSYICIHVCILMYTYVCVCVYVYVCICMYVHTHTHTRMCILFVDTIFRIASCV